MFWLYQNEMAKNKFIHLNCRLQYVNTSYLCSYAIRFGGLKWKWLCQDLKVYLVLPSGNWLEHMLGLMRRVKYWTLVWPRCNNSQTYKFTSLIDMFLFATSMNDNFLSSTTFFCSINLNQLTPFIGALIVLLWTWPNHLKHTHTHTHIYWYALKHNNIMQV